VPAGASLLVRSILQQPVNGNQLAGLSGRIWVYLSRSDCYNDGRDLRNGTQFSVSGGVCSDSSGKWPD